ncbi:hypothetical protein [Pseudoxanthomonas sp. CF125]|uniref:hypothetical protein n=1 Tax=Pseudoxanthomonas sp. CF125 TaxID=1855303 RepID=UPI00088588D8|nr:hypothetical protein [Pseudoxanthomonas sp. CF125]SDQ43527.1 hypothetical protein SAMN05216569_1113 [Pseudoxanthomonas sp. CF125]
MSNWPAILGRQLKFMAELESRFKSGNSVPVERTYLTRTEFDGLSEYMLEEEDISTMSGMANLRLQERVEELEVACAQAVEFAEYVEGAAKGKMADRAKHYLSLPYSQELAARLLPGREAG